MMDIPAVGEPCPCSFCRKDRTEVEFLFAGPTAFICNECVDLCREILDHERTERRRRREAESAAVDEVLEWEKQLLWGAWRGEDP